MQIKREVGGKGQVVIPKDIREQMNVRPGSTIVFEVKDSGEIVIRPEKTGKEFVEYFCNVGKKLGKSPTAKELKKILETQLEERHGLHRR